MIKIIIHTASRGQYTASIDGQYLAAARELLFAAARVVLAEGHSQDTSLVMRHAGSATTSLTPTIGRAARLTVLENDHRGPCIAPYRPTPGEDAVSHDTDAAPAAFLGSEAPEPLLTKTPVLERVCDGPVTGVPAT